MDKDKNRNLMLQKDEVQEILAGIFRLNFSEQTQACERVMNYSNAVSYEDFMRNALLFYLCELDPKKNINNFEIKENDFLSNIERILHFVNVKPADHILRSCFKDADRDRDGVISKNEYIGMLRNIFENYVFDKRGLPQKTRLY